MILPGRCRPGWLLMMGRRERKEGRKLNRPPRLGSTNPCQRRSSSQQTPSTDLDCDLPAPSAVSAAGWACPSWAEVGRAGRLATCLAGTEGGPDHRWVVSGTAAGSEVFPSAEVGEEPSRWSPRPLASWPAGDAEPSQTILKQLRGRALNKEGVQIRGERLVERVESLSEGARRCEGESDGRGCGEGGNAGEVVSAQHRHPHLPTSSLVLFSRHGLAPLRLPHQTPPHR
jgi:hypothetical protein